MNKVVVIGNFDGVHLGHQAVLRAAREMAGDGSVVALSFWPHPLSIVHPDSAPGLLCDISDRVALLRAAGADEVSIVEFTPAVAAWSPERFVEKVVWELRPTTVIVGENFRFGARAAADADDMRRLADGRFEVTVLPLLCDTEPVSSSRIRQAVAEGDMAAARHMLGRWFRYSDIVMLGDQRGRGLGFPTANLAVPDTSACPADAVYAGYLNHDGTRWPAAISVGTNPTFDGVVRHVEAYAITETDLRLYGERIGVDFVARLRGQLRFESRQALIDQMKADVERALVVLEMNDARGEDLGNPALAW